MSTDDTNATRQGSGSNDLLGPLPEAATTGTFPGPHGYSREQMRAYAAHELESLQDSYGQLMADNVRLRAELDKSKRGEHICLKCGLRQDGYDAAAHAAAYPGF